MDIPKKYFILSFILITTFAIVINELNIRAIRQGNPENIFHSNRSLVYNSTISSIDSKWYVEQIKNFMDGKGFTADPSKYNYSVRRTPVYPLFYGIHYLLFGEERSYFFIRYTQVLLFALATIALFTAAYNFTLNKKIAFISAFLFGTNLTLISFLYFTITEGISASLVCFFLYFLSLCRKYNRRKDWLLTGLFFALASLCRPLIFATASSVFIVLVFLNYKQFKKLVVDGLFFGFGAGILFVPYIIRNYIETKGDIIILEKYYGDPMDYGMPNMELRHWISAWKNPADYSSEEVSNHMQLLICCDTSTSKDTVLAQEMRKLPERALLVNKKEAIRDAYAALYDYYDAKSGSKPGLDSLEKLSSSKFIALKKEFISKAPLQYYLVTPLLIVKSVVLQSNSAPIAFLDNYRDHYLKFFLKFLLYVLNIYLFVSLLCLAFLKNHRMVYLMTLSFVFILFAYITLVVKNFEARYLVPLFPFMYMTGAIFLYEIFSALRKRSDL